ncbi:DUF305 domain-containing protein [Paraburkholderia nodosa]|uniref:DUF305 domain-containing protein n=1 Tax=Paraburkholderia nodosa TaxID=392320 RepID=UPI0004ACD81B|nr:DUF305 domain-containing protein [Paraburkholderia nodosa]
MRSLWSWPHATTSAAALLFFSVLSQAGHAAGPEAAYLKENDVAMTKMMNAMTVDPTGDVDRDFVAMMVPHHQGAIDMAQAELRYGKNAQLRRIAQEIVVEQQQEIVAMHVALGQALPPSAPSPDQMGATPHASSVKAARRAAGAMDMQHVNSMSTHEEK